MLQNPVATVDSTVSSVRRGPTCRVVSICAFIIGFSAKSSLLFSIAFFRARQEHVSTLERNSRLRSARRQGSTMKGRLLF
jgi:hypothetical protein